MGGGGKLRLQQEDTSETQKLRDLLQPPPHHILGVFLSATATSWALLIDPSSWSISTSLPVAMICVDGGVTQQPGRLLLCITILWSMRTFSTARRNGSEFVPRMYFPLSSNISSFNQSARGLHSRRRSCWTTTGKISFSIALGVKYLVDICKEEIIMINMLN